MIEIEAYVALGFSRRIRTPHCEVQQKHCTLLSICNRIKDRRSYWPLEDIEPRSSNVSCLANFAWPSAVTVPLSAICNKVRLPWCRSATELMSINVTGSLLIMGVCVSEGVCLAKLMCVCRCACSPHCDVQQNSDFVDSTCKKDCIASYEWSSSSQWGGRVLR